MLPPLMPVYPQRLPIAFKKGSGVWLTDTKNERYLDALSGIGVCGLGHSHPKITQVLCKQAARLIHISNAYQIPQQEQLASNLVRLSGMDQVFFSNSGAESNEAAIKMTRLYARKKNISHPIIIAMKKAFHGRTMASISLSGNPRLQIGFEPLLEQFVHIPFNDTSTLEHVIKQHKENIVAILLEPIQGDGGIQAVTPDFLKTVRDYCNQYDWLMILDEIQTGLCRTGSWFAYQLYGILPDILTLAKTLGNGFPIGAYCARGKANNLFAKGQHGSTFAGTPLACSVAITVLKTLEEDNMAEHVKKIGDYLIKKLQLHFEKNRHVISIRGRGLMIGIELDRTCLTLPSLGLRHRLLFNIVSNNTIRLLPAFIIQKTEADEICYRLGKILDEFYSLP